MRWPFRIGKHLARRLGHDRLYQRHRHLGVTELIEEEQCGAKGLLMLFAVSYQFSDLRFAASVNGSVNNDARVLCDAGGVLC